MKKFKLVLFVALVVFVSCGERYEEVRGSVFEGTWTLFESYVDTVKVPLNRGKFFKARDFDGEKLLLFYSGGRYDSSFFYRIQNNNLFVRKVKDSIDIIRYYLLDSENKPITDTANRPIVYRSNIDQTGSLNLNRKYQIIDTVREAWKPLNPSTNYSPEKYYGTYSFNEGAQLTLTINRYFTDKDGAPTDKLYGRDIYLRPIEKE
jgi:hypothetical protein